MSAVRFLLLPLPPSPFRLPNNPASCLRVTVERENSAISPSGSDWEVSGTSRASTYPSSGKKGPRESTACGTPSSDGGNSSCSWQSLERAGKWPVPPSGCSRRVKRGSPLAKVVPAGIAQTTPFRGPERSTKLDVSVRRDFGELDSTELAEVSRAEKGKREKGEAFFKETFRWDGS
jgi:hypothetical protein